jgi:ABC-type multidrug transport system fused ATPase/permease subunit
MILTGGSSTHPDVAAALRDCRRAFGSVALLSGIVNLLMLAGPLYMLQVYDRVLSSRSVPTLVALSIFLVGTYVFQGVLDLIRSRVVVRAAMLLDQRLALAAHVAMLRLSMVLFGAGRKLCARAVCVGAVLGSAHAPKPPAPSEPADYRRWKARCAALLERQGISAARCGNAIGGSSTSRARRQRTQRGRPRCFTTTRGRPSSGWAGGEQTVQAVISP